MYHLSSLGIIEKLRVALTHSARTARTGSFLVFSQSTNTMPQFLDSEAVVPIPVRTIPSGKSVMVVCSTDDEIIKSLTENGFACLKPDFTAPWKELEVMMNKLDQETIEKINSFYNEKKIVKSPKLTDKENIDK